MSELKSLQPLPCLGVQGFKERTNKGTFNFKRTMNEQSISVDHESKIKSLHPDLVFKERDRT